MRFIGAPKLAQRLGLHNRVGLAILWEVRTARKKLDLAEIRRTAITALFSDDVLTDYLVLKGGNVLDLVLRDYFKSID
jgi:hypothetical protein